MAYFGDSGRMAGDPGFFSTLGKIGRSALRNLPGIGAPVRAAEFFQRPSVGTIGRVGSFRGPVVGKKPGVTIGKDGVMRKKRRRMNVGNTKALKRAVRRTDGFVKLAKDALKSTGFTVVSKSSLATRRASASASARRHHRT